MPARADGPLVSLFLGAFCSGEVSVRCAALAARRLYYACTSYSGNLETCCEGSSLARHRMRPMSATFAQPVACGVKFWHKHKVCAVPNPYRLLSSRLLCYAYLCRATVPIVVGAPASGENTNHNGVGAFCGRRPRPRIGQ